MLGAIIGDIAGSVYEWNNIKTKDFPLFREECVFTDDFLEDRTIAKNPAKCRFCSDGASAASTGKEA